MSDDLVEMARLAQHDERMATGALYGDLSDRIEELEAKLAKAVEGFEELARLGNGDRYGNSFGNLIAQRYIAELTGEADAT